MSEQSSESIGNELGDSWRDWFYMQRTARGLNQEKFAELIGIGPATAQRLERSYAKPPSKGTLRLIAEALIPDESKRAAFYLQADRLQHTLSPHGDPSSCDLPNSPRDILGRDREIQGVKDLLAREDVQLVTLTGGPGVGKTRLGIEVARALLHEYKKRVYFIGLTESSRSNLAATIWRCFGFVERLGMQFSEEALKNQLRRQKKSRLLVLDNFDYISPDSGGTSPDNEVLPDQAWAQACKLVGDLLEDAPQLKILVTSRELLELVDEKEIHLHPLPQAAAVALFRERAGEKQEGFDPPPDHASMVAEICAQLDGIPLAIELAVAQLFQHWRGRLSAMLEDLRKDPLPSLVQPLTDLRLDPRHKTMTAAIASSYQKLSHDQQRFFQWLGIFVGGFTDKAATTIYNQAIQEHASDTPTLDVKEGRQALEALEGFSLLEQAETATEEFRFTMLQVLREFALSQLSQLKDTGELDTLRRLHGEYFTMVAEKAEPEFHGPKQGALLDQLEEEYDNILAALKWASDVGAVEHGLRLCVALGFPWEVENNRYSEGLEQLQRFTDLAKAAKHPELSALLARALAVAGKLSWRKGDWEGARKYFRGSMELGQDLMNNEIKAHASLGLGLTSPPGRDRWLTEALTLFKQAFGDEDCYEIGYTYFHMGYGHPNEDGQRELTKALGIAERLDDTSGRSHAHLQLAVLALRLADDDGWQQAGDDAEDQLQQLKEAEDHCRQTLDLAKRRGKDKWLIGFAHLCLGWSLLNKIDEARDELLRSRQIFEDMNEEWGQVYILRVGSIIALRQDDPKEAASLLGAYVQGMSELSNSSLPPALPSGCEDLIDIARIQLADDTLFHHFYRKGKERPRKESLDRVTGPMPED